jgi:3-oxoacyl-[acyl-carrier protein] reductase
MAERELEGRVALVTGGGRNIGRATALALAGDGAAIVVNVRSNQAEAEAVAAEIKAKGGKALAVVADVADASAVKTMADAALKQFGRIDFLVNNAAMRRESAIEDMSYDDWRELMGVSLDGPFHCVKACLESLKASGVGAIVNVGGMSAHTGSRDRVHVTTAKAGLVGFTRGLAHDLAGKVTVNLVVPGLIGTPRAGPEPAHHHSNKTLTGGRGKPEDVAAMIRFLCGPGGRYVTGQTIHVNGGAYFGS